MRKNNAWLSLKITLGISAVLTLLHCIGHIVRFSFGLDDSKGIIRLFNLEYEQNIPTLWSSLLLFYVAVLLARLCRRVRSSGGPYLVHWALLALAFFYLSFDEFFELHEKSMRPVHQLLDTGGVLLYSWIIPAGLAVLVMGVVYLRFLQALPLRTRNLFLLSAFIYVGSAILFELPEGWIESQGGWMNLPYTILVTFEEFLEMAGICLFSYAVLDAPLAGKDEAGL